jgi:hypothetical protein
MIKKQWLGVLVGAALTVGYTAAAADNVPAWSKQEALALAEQGLAVIPDGGVDQMSREDMARLTANALAMSRSGGQTDIMRQLAEEYTTISRMAAQDEAMLHILENQYKEAESQYKEILSRIERNEKNQVYVALQGGDGGRESHLLAEEKQNEKDLSSAVSRMAGLKARIEPGKARMASWESRKQTILDEMAGLADSHAGSMAAAAGRDAAQSVYSHTGSNGLPVSSPLYRMQVEYAPELEKMGFFDEEKAQDMAVLYPPERPVDTGKRFKVDGEVRLDGRDNSNHHTLRSDGVSKYPDDRMRFRTRVYMDYNIDDNWHAMGMLESEKSLSGESGMDGEPDLDRYYLTGHMGAAEVTAGAFGSYMAEGNIYDSKFKGAMVRYGDGQPWTFAGLYGEVNEADDVKVLTASYDTDSYGFDAGYYLFHMDNGSDRHIGMLNYRRPLGGWMNFGAMLLHGNDDEADGGTGYVFTLSRGKENSWLKGNVYGYIKYYYQPEATYVEHTMNGMADYMHGFKGPGIGLSYTLKKDWVLSMEYDHLRDLQDNDSNNTFWAGLSYYFNNYQSDYEEIEQQD